MKIKANLLNKPVNFQMDDCQIEKVVELPRDQFSALVITPLTNQPFIAENKRWMFADDSAVHCLLVLGQGSGDGVLIYSAGYDYPRLAAYLPGMRDMYRICGGDFADKMHLLLDYTDRPNQEVADPWYTDNFEATWRDVSDGCQGLLDHLMIT